MRAYHLHHTLGLNLFLCVTVAVTPKNRNPNLTKRNADVKSLIRMITSGETDRSVDIKDGFEKYSTFRKNYELKKFRTCFSNLLDEQNIPRPNEGTYICFRFFIPFYLPWVIVLINDLNSSGQKR